MTIAKSLTHLCNVGISAPAGKLMNNRDLKSLEYNKRDSVFKVNYQNEELPPQSVTSEFSYMQERKALSRKKSITREYKSNSK